MGDCGLAPRGELQISLPISSVESTRGLVVFFFFPFIASAWVFHLPSSTASGC